MINTNPHRPRMDHPTPTSSTWKAATTSPTRRPRPHPSTTHRHRHRPKHQPPLDSLTTELADEEPIDEMITLINEGFATIGNWQAFLYNLRLRCIALHNLFKRYTPANTAATPSTPTQSRDLLNTAIELAVKGEEKANHLTETGYQFPTLPAPGTTLREPDHREVENYVAALQDEDIPAQFKQMAALRERVSDFAQELDEAKDANTEVPKHSNSRKTAPTSPTKKTSSAGWKSTPRPGARDRPRAVLG